jgi:hypothetical protein
MRDRTHIRGRAIWQAQAAITEGNLVSPFVTADGSHAFITHPRVFGFQRHIRSKHKAPRPDRSPRRASRRCGRSAGGPDSRPIRQLLDRIPVLSALNHRSRPASVPGGSEQSAGCDDETSSSAINGTRSACNARHSHPLSTAPRFNFQIFPPENIAAEPEREFAFTDRCFRSDRKARCESRAVPGATGPGHLASLSSRCARPNER